MRTGPALATLWLALAPAVAEEPGTAAPAAAPAATPPATPPAAPPATLEVTGPVLSVDLQQHRLTVETAAGAVELAWDRNTLIYQPGGATTSGALRPGALVKAGLDPGRTAYWIQLRPAPPPAAPATLEPPAAGP